MTTIRVLLVDDHRIITDGLKELLSDAEGVECIGTCADGAEAIAAVGHLLPDVVLMDLDMPVLDGITATERVKRSHPRVRVVMLSMHGEPAVVRRVMEAGADGYLVKNCGKEELLLAIRQAHQGNRHFASGLLEELLTQQREKHAADGLLKELSGREVEVLAALAEGLGNKEIGNRLSISPRTVDTHRTNLMRKLNTHSVAGLVRLAIKAGLVQ